MRQPCTLTAAQKAADPLSVIGDWSSPGKKRRERDEDKLHKAVWKTLCVTLDQSVVAWSVENRGNGAIEGSIRKARGCLSGVPDLQIMHQGATVFIELKAPNGSVSIEQRALHARLRHAGFAVHVCRTIEQVLEVLRVERIPHRHVA